MGNTWKWFNLTKTDEEIRQAIIDYVTNNQVHAKHFLFEGIKKILPDEQLYRKRVIFKDIFLGYIESSRPFYIPT
jgi:hypothetical protein